MCSTNTPSNSVLCQWVSTPSGSRCPESQRELASSGEEVTELESGSVPSWEAWSWTPVWVSTFMRGEGRKWGKFYLNWKIFYSCWDIKQCCGLWVYLGSSPTCSPAFAVLHPAVLRSGPFRSNIDCNVGSFPSESNSRYKIRFPRTCLHTHSVN